MITVFGSINVDLVFPVPILPRAGETVLGSDYRVALGGKGANQAVAAARDGAKVRFYGRIGRDEFGRMARAGLVAAGVDVAGVAESVAPTGCAAICVDAAGRNQIAVAGGANLELRAADVPDAALGPGTTLVLQMEAPADEVARLILRAHARGVFVILNLAPARALGHDALRGAGILVVNESEAAALAHTQQVTASEAAAIARELAAVFGNTVVVTLGERGAVGASREKDWSVGALPVTALDTTGAGDAFVGVLAAACDRGETFATALHRASIAGSLACLAPGAQPSLPTKAAIDARLGDLPSAI